MCLKINPIWAGETQPVLGCSLVDLGVADDLSISAQT